MTGDGPLEEGVNRVSALLEARIGLRTEPTVRARLRRGIRDEAADQGLGLEHYLDTVVTGGPVLQQLLNRITVQETSFFRHPEHFEVLAREVLPGLSRPVRIWSVGCANGQEAFSLAMVLAEEGVEGSVIATDLSTNALARTTAATYTAREAAGLSPARIARHLHRSGTGWEVDRSLRTRVSTLRHNLTGPLPEQVTSCQVVFCRNVLIYIAHEPAAAFLARVADIVAPVMLFLGSAETMWSTTDRFETVRMGETFVYRPRPPAGAAPDGRPAPGATATAPDGRPRTSGIPGGHPPDRHRPGGHPPGGRRPTGATPPGGSVPAGATPPGGSVPAGAVPTGATPTGRAPVAPGRRRLPADPGRPGTPTPAADRDDAAAVTRLTRDGEQALATGDHGTAIACFRKWAYLSPDDTLAHLHLGLALEAAGDGPSANRAFAAARRAVTEADPDRVEQAIEGYATVELLRLLDAKHRASGR